MKLGMNTFVYEVARWSIKDTLKSIKKLGFEYVDFAAWDTHDPTKMSKSDLKDFVSLFKDLGLKCSQMLLVGTHSIASPNASKREETLDYMKRCTDVLQELGDGRQVLICWGGGLHLVEMTRSRAWSHMIDSFTKYAQWGLDKGVLADVELDPHVYFVINDTWKMAEMIEEINLPNIFPNVDIGHLFITREGPETLEKLSRRILHIHLSETDTYEHTNSILGTGVVDFKSYVDKCVELGIEENCARHGETAVAGIELGEPGADIDNPERWVQESLNHLAKVLPDLKM